MKELLKKASLTLAFMCLFAGSLVSGGWAGQHAEESRSERLLLSSTKTEKQQAMPDELNINGQKYKKVKAPFCIDTNPNCPGDCRVICR